MYNTQYLPENFEQYRLEKTILWHFPNNLNVRSRWIALIHDGGKNMKALIRGPTVNYVLHLSNRCVALRRWLFISVHIPFEPQRYLLSMWGIQNCRHLMSWLTFKYFAYRSNHQMFQTRAKFGQYVIKESLTSMEFDEILTRHLQLTVLFHFYHFRRLSIKI